MNYLKHYILLIRKAMSHPPNGYYEKHHVFPKSIFGNNNYIVRLTARQHYIAHALLEKIYIKRYGFQDMRTKKMIHAFFMMNNTIGHGQERYVNSRLFESSKLRFSERMSGKNSPCYGKKRTFSKTHVDKIKASRKRGEDNPFYKVPRSEEVINKLKKPKRFGHGEAVSAARQGITFSKEHKKNLSESHKGQIPWNKGKSWSTEHKEKLSQIHKNKDKSFMTDEYKNKISESMKKVWEERRRKKQQEIMI